MIEQDCYPASLRRRSRYRVNRKLITHRRYKVRRNQLNEADKTFHLHVELKPLAYLVDARSDAKMAQSLLQSNLLLYLVATGIEHQAFGRSSTSTTIIHKPHRQPQGIQLV